MAKWSLPKTCPAGHVLVPGEVKVGWDACDCDKATGSPPGHQYVMCLVCDRERRWGGCDRLVDGHPVKA